MVPRRRALAVLGGALLGGCLEERTGTATGTRATTDGETPTSRSDTASSTSPSETATPDPRPGVRWSRELDTEIRSAPLFHDGTLYVGGADGLLRALDPSDGSERWTFEAPDRMGSWAMAGTGLRAAGGHLLAVSGAFDGLHGQDNRVHALDPASGTERWTYAPGDSYVAFGLLSPTDGAVYVVGNDDALADEGEHARAVDLDDGSERWRTETGDASDGATGAGHCYVTAQSVLYALGTPDGGVAWTAEADGYGSMSVAADDRNVYFLREDEESDLVALAHEDGRRRWSGPSWSATSLGLADDCYVGGERLAAFAPDGEVRWENPAGGYVRGVPVADGALFAGRRGRVVAVDVGTGADRWSRNVDADVAVPESLADGVLVTRLGNDADYVAHDAASGERRWELSLGAEDAGVVTGRGAAFVVARDGEVVAREL